MYAARCLVRAFRLGRCADVVWGPWLIPIVFKIKQCIVCETAI